MWVKFHPRGMGHSVLLVALVVLQSVVVNCAPYIRRSESDGPSSNSSASSVAPAAIYNGSYANAHQRGILLRIGNGGAGQSGLIGALANAFIQYRVSQGDAPFEVSCDWPKLGFF